MGERVYGYHAIEEALKKAGKCSHQLFCKEDFSLKRWLWYQKSQLNYYRKTARYYGNKSLKG